MVMRQKGLAAAIVLAIWGVVGVVVYSPVHVGGPDPAPPPIASARPLPATRVAGVPPMAFTRAAVKRRPAADRRQPAAAVVETAVATLPRVTAAPDPLAATFRTGAMLLPSARQADLPEATSPGPRPSRAAAVPEAGRAVGAAFATAGRSIGSAFRRVF